jgi:hypothetical protein
MRRFKKIIQKHPLTPPFKVIFVQCLAVAYEEFVYQASEDLLDIADQ